MWNGVFFRDCIRGLFKEGPFLSTHPTKNWSVLWLLESHSTWWRLESRTLRRQWTPGAEQRWPLTRHLFYLEWILILDFTRLQTQEFFFFLCDGLYLQDEKSELPKLTVTAYSSRQAELSAKLELPSHPLYVCSSLLTAPRWPRSSRLCTCVTLNPSPRSGRAQADISAAWKNSSQCFGTAGFYCCCCTLDRSAHANISLSGWLDMFLLKRTTTLTKEKSTSSLFYLVNLKCAICKNLKNVKKWHFMYEWYRDLCWVSMLTKPLSSPYLYEVVNKSQLIRMLTALSGYSGDVLPPICL